MSPQIPFRDPDARVLHTLHGLTMGTHWRVDLCASARAPLDGVHDGIQARLDTLVAQMSTWEADSDLSRFNRAAAGTWHALPAEFFAVLSQALDVARDSAGAFDPTVGPLVAAWGFGAHAGPAAPPDATALAAARARVGWQRITLDPARGCARQPGGIDLDLSAIAKGFAVDAVAAWLRHIGMSAALVEVGGELSGFGRKPDGTSWRVLVETGEDNGEAPCVLALDGCAVATSGTRWFRHACDGHEYAHTIDPRSGRPVEDAPVAVTVVADSAMRADAWATALSVMGVEQGHAFACGRGLAARFVPHGHGRDDARVRTTPAFDVLVERP